MTTGTKLEGLLPSDEKYAINIHTSSDSSEQKYIIYTKVDTEL